MTKLAIALFFLAGTCVSGAEQPLPKGHSWVYLQVELTDTRGKGIELKFLPIRLQRFVSVGKFGGDLEHVEPLGQRREGEAGVYYGRIPMDGEDERWLQQLEIRPSGYEPLVFMPRRMLRQDPKSSPERGNGQAKTPYRYGAVLARNYSLWRPVLHKFSTLNTTITSLLENSGNVEYLPVPDKPTWRIGKIAKETYDHTQASQETHVRDSKAGFLNIMAALRVTTLPDDGPPIATYLKELRRVNEERAVVEVKSELFDRVDELADLPSAPYACGGVDAASSSLHGRNFYNLLPGDPVAEITSVKISLCRGSLQVTICRFREAPQGKVLATFADFDVDQNRGWAHLRDTAAQHNRFPTSPVLVFDMLGAALKPADWDIGYHLELIPTR